LQGHTRGQRSERWQNPQKTFAVHKLLLSAIVFAHASKTMAADGNRVFGNFMFMEDASVLS
jgi:hypothetical protein